MLNSLVSIIIPVFNGSNYLREAIDSALAQTYKNIEVIIVNDGSTDDTEKIVKSYGDKIRYFAKENGGVASALNLALQEMKGEYFSWLSHDDVYYPDKIEKQIKFLSLLENKDVILYSDYRLIDEASNEIKTIVLDHEMLVAKPEYVLLRNVLNGITLLIPKKAFDDYGFFDEKLKCTQDYDKWFEMMQVYKFIHIPEILIKYRIHQMQDTNKNPNFEIEGDILWIKMINDLAPEIKIRLEGSEFNFYKEMIIYLVQSPYKEAMEFCKKKIKEILIREKEAALPIEMLEEFINDAEQASRSLYDKDRLVENLNQVVQQKNQEIENLNQVVQQKNQEMENLNQVVQQKNQEINLEKQEVVFIKSSKFWKLRNLYLRVKNNFK